MTKNDLGGVWRTVGGRRIFIKDGQDLASAMIESGKFNNEKISKSEASINGEKIVDNKYNELTKKIEDIFGIKFKERETYNNFAKRNATAEINIGNHTIVISALRELPSDASPTNHMIITAQDNEKVGTSGGAEISNLGKSYSYGILETENFNKIIENGNFEDLIEKIDLRIDYLKKWS